MPSNKITIVRGRPSFLTAQAREDAANLLTQSGLIREHTAMSRINRAFLVLIGYNNGRPVATLSVKKPDREYVTNLFQRAGVVHNGESLEFGYLYAPPGSGTMFNGPRLYRNALEVVRRQGTPFYAVTRADNNTMIRYLSRKLGWFGSLPFKSDIGSHKLILWTATPQSRIVTPVPRTRATVVNKMVDTAGYVSGRVYIGTQHAGKRVKADVVVTDDNN